MERLRSTIKFQEDNKMADMVLDHISEDLHTWAVNLSREKFERDQISAFAYAREKGLKKGLKKGMKKGFARGSHAAKLETAANLKRMGMSFAQISEAIGLSLEEIQKLK